MFALTSPVASLDGVGPKRAGDLAAAGIRTIEDLLNRFPLRYEDRSRFRSVADVQPGEAVTLTGELINCDVRFTRRRNFTLFTAAIRDDSGVLALVWPNQPYLSTTLRPHLKVIVYGRVERWRDRLQMTAPDCEVVESDDGQSLHTGRIVPVYERLGAVTSKLQRRLVWQALERLNTPLEESIPEEVRERVGLPERKLALEGTHFPGADVPIDTLNAFRTAAQQRLIFEEFFLFQLGLAARRRERLDEQKPFAVRVNDTIRRAARQALPFRLTPGQRDALGDIVSDMREMRPMNRLLQGDVGCGKTIVAVLAALVAMENGLQVAFMAPTELLAEQHGATLSRLLAGRPGSVEVLTSATAAAERSRIRARLRRGDVCVAVGTHALVQKGVDFARLGLVIVDEQHRFGVLQRAALRDKGLRPDVLVMTATPIPRTLALTLFGDLDVSVIKDLPPGRTAVETSAAPLGARKDVYREVRAELDQGRQAYVVYPLVEESEKVDLAAATRMADHLASDVFPAFRVGLLHGRMTAEQRDAVMRQFVAREVDLLVATTVIEVGIDVPNATMMIVEHAERFGLAQLHQLRGRVGRGTHRSRCVLLYQAPVTPEARRRLDALVATTDGFVIAERDLELRGPGDLSGLRQAGLPMLRVGDLRRDHDLMAIAHREAEAWAGRRDEDATRLLESARGRWAQRFGLASVG